MKAWAIKLLDTDEIHVYVRASRKSIKQYRSGYLFNDARIVRVRITEIKPRKRRK